MIRSIACVENDEDCLATLNRNKAIGIKSGVHKWLNSAEIIDYDLRYAGRLAKQFKDLEVDIVMGGPPCQSYSVLGKRRGLNDVRGGLVFSFFEFVSELRPRAFVMENVPGFRSMDKGSVFRQVFNEMTRLGYQCWEGKLCAADFGDATIRSRFFLIGTLKPALPPKAPSPTHQSNESFHSNCPMFSLADERAEKEKLKPYVTVGDALSGLGPPNDGSGPVNSHVAVAHRPETIARFATLSPGERDKARRRNRLDPKSPSLTLFAGGVKGKKQARTHIHPEHPREITPRECARLHRFPDDWVFVGPSDSVLVQVANSVPVYLAKAVGEVVVRSLNG